MAEFDYAARDRQMTRYVAVVIIVLGVFLLSGLLTALLVGGRS